MAGNDLIGDTGRPLDDGRLKRALQELRRTDNFTNWMYIGRAYAIVALASGAAILFHQWQPAAGVSFWWNVPVWGVAIVLAGASQHQLAGATHEATHQILFKHRLLNELVSDWLCMFPLFSSTYTFRLHHLAHHQFINDPARDPDFAQLRQSGHWLGFPVAKTTFLRMLLTQLLLAPLVRYTIARARFNAVGVHENPYTDAGRSFSAWPMRIAIAYVFALAPALALATWMDEARLLAAVPAVGLASVTAVLLAIPAHRYPVARLRPVVAARTTLISRLTFATLLFAGVAWTQHVTGAPVWVYFSLLWIAPLFTTFAFFMMLRQLVQHGNADRGWLTNTRTFLVNPLVRYAVFPFGMDYHLPHHMYATVPHYRLPALHRFLTQDPEYARRGRVVEGYFFPRTGASGRNPTVLDVLGPEYSMRGDEIFVDAAVLDGCLEDDASAVPGRGPARSG